MKKRFLCILFSLLGMLLTAQNDIPVFVTDSLDSHIQKNIKDWNIPGIAVAIVKNGKVIYCKGFGVTKENGNELVDENTLFLIGSNTKLFTATTLTILQNEKKLNLSDHISKWIPNFRLKDSLANKNVNIYDMLSHRIGFETFQGDFTYWTSNLSRADVVKKMGLVEPLYDFRTKWGYCNACYLTAGEIIPEVSGKSWEQIVKEKILNPLKMNRTLMMSNELKTASNVAYPHTIFEQKIQILPIPDLNSLAPAASMSSCAKDMSLWLLAQLNNGKMGEEQVIPKEAILATRKPYSILNVDQRNNQKTHFYLYGLGLMINDRNGKLVYSHTGAVDGFLSSLVFIPEENVGIMVMTNTDQNNFFQSLTNDIRDAFLGLPYQGFSQKSLEINKETLKKSIALNDSIEKIIAANNKLSLPLEKYTGKYTNSLYGKIEIKITKQFLTIYFENHPDLTAKLAHIKNDVFLCTYSNPTMGVTEIPFLIKNGAVEGLTLTVADFLEFTSYQFNKE